MAELYIFGEHQHAFEAWSHSDIKGSVLLHFDAHHDCSGCDGNFLAAAPPLDKLGPANFIAPAVLLGMISEVVWVLPSWAENDEKLRDQYWKGSGGDELGRSLYGPEKDITLYVVQLENEVACGPLPYAGPGKRLSMEVPFRVRKVYSKELPDGLSGCAMDFDADYFDCTGFDTFGVRIKERGLGEIQEEIKALCGLLRSKGISSELITIAMSPDYAYSDKSAPIIRALKNGLTEAGIIRRPYIEKALGREYDAATVLLAKSLLQKASSDLKGDPRAGGCSAAAAKKYLGSVSEFEMMALGDAAHRIELNSAIVRRAVRSKRGDYDLFVKEAARLGDNELSGALGAFLVFYLDPAASFDEIRASFGELERSLGRIIMSPGSLFLSAEEIDRTGKDLAGANKSILDTVRDMTGPADLLPEFSERLNKLPSLSKEEKDKLFKELLDRAKEVNS